MFNESRSFSIAMMVSLVCHLLFFAVLLYAQDRQAEKPFAPSIINVSMVTLPPQGKAARSGKQSLSKETAPEAKAPEAPKPAPVTPPASAPPEVSVAPEKRSEKTSLKKKTFKTDKVVQSAIKEIEQKVETTQPDPLSEALDRLRNKVEKEEADQSKNTVGRLDSGGQPNGTGGASGLSGKQVADLIDIYRVEIAYQVQKHWAFSEQLAGKEKKLQASLVFKVMPDGQIKDLFFTDRSGNSYLDDSAYKAVIKSNPVAPHPEGISKPFIHVGLRFTPEGVE
jgi:colicin import membrane protein